jgi:hypothetical protein
MAMVAFVSGCKRWILLLLSFEENEHDMFNVE